MRLMIAASLLPLASVALAQAPAAAVNNSAAPRAEKKICKVDPEDTESRIRRRICKTEAEWRGASDPKHGGPWGRDHSN